MSRILDEATAALGRLDAERLVDLEQRAQGLQSLLAAGGPLDFAELAARHRVFAAVVQATCENLGVLERVAAPSEYGGSRNQWAH